jgi:hypothetical protein
MCREIIVVNSVNSLSSTFSFDDTNCISFSLPLFHTVMPSLNAIRMSDENKNDPNKLLENQIKEDSIIKQSWQYEILQSQHKNI